MNENKSKLINLSKHYFLIKKIFNFFYILIKTNLYQSIKNFSYILNIVIQLSAPANKYYIILYKCINILIKK